jgi:hypothetical protein
MSTPSIVPDASGTIYLLLNDFGSGGRAWVETDEHLTDAQSVIDNLVTAQFDGPVRVVAFNTTQGWARDVSVEIAHAVVRRSEFERRDLSEGVQAFVERHIHERV